MLASVAQAAQASGSRGQGAAQRREVVDMMGRRVSLPAQINRIMTIGAVPVLNSFVFAFGDGDKIVNGLPLNFSSPHYKFQQRFAPSLATKPKLDGGSRAPNTEQVLAMTPDVVFTMDRETAEHLGEQGIAVIGLAWRKPEDTKQLVALVGQVLNKPAVADEYARYFDQTVARVSSVAARIPREQRVRALYCSVKRLTTDHLIIEWWIETAGGLSVTNNGRQTESFAFTMEQLLAWNPDVMFVASEEEKAALNADARFAVLKAVKTHRVYIVPSVAHAWGHRTIEQPLTLLFAAQKMYPQRFKDVDMVKEMQRFYGGFFHYKMSVQEAQEILNGHD
jgi:iron complex transport system substrate-binding protein